MLRVSEHGIRRRESYIESYRQMGESLLQLQTAADQIFDRISQRTFKEREKLAEISQRIQTAKASIDAISRSKQPLVISSPSRYPSSCITDEDFQPLFQCKDEDCDDYFPKTLLVNGGLNREFGKDGTLELFQFFSEENTACPFPEAQLKFVCSFFVGNSNTSGNKLEIKKQDLPPAPPSLFLHNIPSLRKAEAATTRTPVCATKLPDALSDLTPES